MSTVALQVQQVFLKNFIAELQNSIKVLFQRIITFLSNVPLKVKNYFGRLIDDAAEYVAQHEEFQHQIRAEFPSVEGVLPSELAVHVVDRIYWRETSDISSDFLLSFVELEYQTLGMSPYFMDFEAVTKLKDSLIFIRNGNNEDIFQVKLILDRLQVLTAMQTLVGEKFAHKKDRWLFQEEMEIILEVYASRSSIMEHAELVLLELGESEEDSQFHIALKKMYRRLKKEEILEVI